MVSRLSLFIVLALCVSCASALKTVEEEPAPAADTDLAEPIEEPPEEPAVVFDPANVSPEVYLATKVDVQQFINNLNIQIKNKNFDGWKNALSDEYFERLSSPEFLRQVSNSDRLRARKVVLKNIQDYFIYVVVPSRANDRVDDIDFVTENRVKAYTVDSQGERLRLYELEHLYELQQLGDSWKIIN
jgi:hypothetical protein